MKIIVNGILIDTEQILEISEIHEVDDMSGLEFMINFITGTHRRVYKTTLHNYDVIEAQHKDKPYDEFRLIVISLPEYKESLRMFTKGWQQLVDLWSNNQSTIPKIEFK